MMGGLVVLDAYDCRNIPEGRDALLELALRAVEEAEMHPIENVARHFSREEYQSEMGDSVITLIVPLRESHLAIHTWPHYRFVSVDLYTCGSVKKAQVAVDNLVRYLAPEQYEMGTYPRGKHIRREV